MGSRKAAPNPDTRANEDIASAIVTRVLSDIDTVHCRNVPRSVYRNVLAMLRDELAIKLEGEDDDG